MRWTRGHVLGRGSSATVSAATSTTGDVFAVKSAVVSQSETLQREQQFLSILNSPFIVAYKGCDITKENKKFMYNLMMQYMPGGTVVDAINNQDCSRLNEVQISSYTRQVLQGLVYIHSNSIVHCDIKGANLLVDESGVKIADFGCAKWANEDAPIRGTPMFMAPEVARGEEQGFPADVWALGCTVIEMATGCSPWLNVTDPVSVLYKIAYSGESPDIPGVLSNEAKDFISKCLIQDPKARWGATQLLKHPFIEQLNCNIDQDLWTESPTGILDQYVWNSIGESQSVGTDSIQPMCSSFSLRQRIEQLEGNSDMGNWRWKMEEEINWMTIRSNGSGGAVADD
ncbi:putative mitogen-activated protein kinase kinase kinase STE-STE11 family [Helianthus annuus]|uniref:Mitogen-activated protein kinase kinase kinase STE-STE11 family n=1 Tax=Helianthus annuus TaxID=4232 RepID=A0A251V7X1_HELAN|nr:mitogen-activated protein kinase kinase kinase 18 [Helianthus annuus]KAF5814230.1 putative mitogen-activated protein kinase kinase kinase STE-STE11 family [Helianthus annuus]KAJ0592888.1 putative mitogen-activated protein kinase kinase kinase STE-STE11 family [Helianthus annuus]KAJ0600582.1 putative mitogen-activated protein kinase kinase kinase STE-STE11 family [Helianthus annuus]KAJ0607890.1 putative mitogen-activated protein kinase kinase kinase STE-STE11 family [Helianthus annuus]KAJ076